MQLPNFLSSGEASRLIPVVADSSREVRATSIVLATMVAVPSFAKAMLASLGQSVGTRTSLNGYTEVVFKQDKDGMSAGRPDGLLMIERSKGASWSCLVESKIGRGVVDAEQVKRYAGIAKAHGLQAVLTISNEFVTLPSHPPVRLPKATLRGVEVLHWSWMHLLTEAMLLLNGEDFDHPAQRLILQEMVRYLSHASVGVSTHDRMNAGWKDLVTSIQTGAALSRTSQMVTESVASWHQETRDMSLLMTRTLNRPVRLWLSRSHQNDPSQRLKDDVDVLVRDHRLSCTLLVPDAAAPIQVLADLRRRSLTVSMSVTAPGDRQRTSSRVNWLLRQLAKSEPDNLHVRATWPGRAPATQATLAALRSTPESLDAGNKALLPVQFEVMKVRDLAGRFAGNRSFLEELEAMLPGFYEQVGQYLRAYVPAPPRVRQAEDVHGPVVDVPLPPSVDGGEHVLRLVPDTSHVEASPEASP